MRYMHTFFRLERKQWMYAALCVVLVTFVYTMTLPKNIGFGDAGTMAAAAVMLGVAHPPGFPTFMLAGKLFSSFH